MIAEQSIREALRAVIDPEIRRNVVELDMVRGVGVRGDHVDVTIALTVAGCPMKADLEGQVRRHVGAVDGVASVGVAFDVMTPEERTALRQRLHPGGGDGGEQKAISLSKRTRVVALASGKGGVGKSTLSVNLAAALAAGGAEVGVVDADIHGYSLPRMLGVSRRPVVVDKMIVPPVAHDLRVMSIGFFLDSEQAVVWRGPMLHRALEQFLTDVHWGELDYLVVDMPPGTGDVAISLGQLLPEPDLVIVTTPQPAAQRVAARTADVAAKTGMRVAGVVENMSFIRCACCGEVSHPFGSGGGRALAEELGVPLLAEIPIDEPLREAADGGTPLVVSSPEAESAQAVAALAEALPGALRPRSGAERISRRLGVLS
jgi:ATP-binding protein involved in chromosome partitioning